MEPSAEEPLLEEPHNSAEEPDESARSKCTEHCRSCCRYTKCVSLCVVLLVVVYVVWYAVYRDVYLEESYVGVNGVCEQGGSVNSCQFFNCGDGRGPSHCDNGHCKCLKGTCKRGNFCVLDSEELLVADVVPVTTESPIFPGAHSKISSALCISGGGARSLSLGLGVMRALHNLHLLSKIDGLSTVSGGAWLGAIYMFANKTKEELLGERTHPSELTPEKLNNLAPGTIGSAANTAIDWVGGLNYMHKTLWIRAVCHTFLKQFGLHDLNTFMAPSAKHVEEIRAKNPAAKNWKFYTPQSDRFKVFIMGGAILGPKGYASSEQGTVSLQMSPDYTGSPFINDVKYTKGSETISPVLGGGFVETFAFGGPSPSLGQGGSKNAKLPAPKVAFSLGDAVGISSAAFAARVANSGVSIPFVKGEGASSFTPEAEMWPVTNKAVSARPYELGDGGFIDNSGIIPMLQRGVRRIIWLIDTDVALSAKTNFCHNTHETDWDPYSLVTNQMTDKFGYFPRKNATAKAGFLDHNQIFEKAAFRPLLCKFQRQINNSEPTVIRETMNLVKNDWWKTPAGKADIVFVYNEPCHGFRKKLPAATLSNFQTNFNSFPNYKTTFENPPQFTKLTARQVNLEAAHSEYFVNQNKELFEDFVGSAKSVV